MKIEFQYFDDCPNWKLTHDRLLQAVPLGAPASEIVMVAVETRADAARLGFHGSPSMIVDGADLFDTADTSARGNLSCRFYGTSDGAPSVEDLTAALTAARESLT